MDAFFVLLYMFPSSIFWRFQSGECRGYDGVLSFLR